MDGVVADTDVVSYLLRLHDTRAALYRPDLEGRLVVISFQTVAELLRWPLERGWGPSRRANWEQSLRRYVVQPWDWELCRRWAQVRADCRRIGHPIDTADAWQAATALHLGVHLVTHNRRHFHRVPG